MAMNELMADLWAHLVFGLVMFGLGLTVRDRLIHRIEKIERDQEEWKRVTGFMLQSLTQQGIVKVRKGTFGGEVQDG